MNLYEKNQYDQVNVVNPLINEKIQELKSLMNTGKPKPQIKQRANHFEGQLNNNSSRQITERAEQQSANVCAADLLKKPNVASALQRS